MALKCGFTQGVLELVIAHAGDDPKAQVDCIADLGKKVENYPRKEGRDTDTGSGIMLEGEQLIFARNWKEGKAMVLTLSEVFAIAKGDLEFDGSAGDGSLWEALARMQPDGEEP